MPRKKKLPPNTPVVVRFSNETMEEVKQAAALLGWADVDVIRLATQIGLVRLKRVNYKVAELVDLAANAPKLDNQEPPKRAAG